METIEPADVGATDTILDVRRHAGSEQIRGAVRYDPKALLDARELVLPFNTEGRIVLDADSADEASKIAERLAAMGAQNVCYLKPFPRSPGRGFICSKAGGGAFTGEFRPLPSG
jgi:hypothetical protein